MSHPLPASMDLVATKAAIDHERTTLAKGFYSDSFYQLPPGEQSTQQQQFRALTKRSNELKQLLKANKE